MTACDKAPCLMPEVYNKGRYGRYINTLTTLGDFGVMGVAFLISYFVLAAHFANPISCWPLREIGMAVLVAFAPVAAVFRGQSSQRSLYMERIIRNAVLAVISQGIIFLFLLFCLGIRQIQVEYFYVFYPTALVLLIVWWITIRKVIKHWRRKGFNFVRVAIVGTGPTALTLLHEMNSDDGFGYRVEGFFSDDPTDLVPAGMHIGSLASLPDFIEDHNIDEVYYTLSGERTDDLRAVINATESHVARFYYVPQINRYVNRSFNLHHLGSVPVLTLMNQPLESMFNRLTKRAFDVCFSSVVMLFSPLVFIPVAIAIKLSSPGPIFFTQLRTGYRGRSFRCYKFRTMKVNAAADTAQATEHDPRKTRVGDFLRRTSIDELPQFFNVLRGDMSVVGPRPHMLKHTEEYSRLIDRYMVRHYIKPGITGWAQVCGYRGQTDEVWKMEQRVEHDVWYIKNWTFLLDLKIIYKTVTNALRGDKNAF